MNGLLLIDKPAGWTSFDAVNKVRSTLSTKHKVQSKKIKVGHCGTLDPFATGLLILAVGKATKQLQDLTGLDKTYEATIELGKTSTTGDPEGEIQEAENSKQKPEGNEVRRVLGGFVGEIEQVPPKFSAVKVGGKRAYKLAREGKEVEVPSRKVTIHELELLEYDHPGVRFRCRVGKGTYIRTLAEDIGAALGTGAYTTRLRRTHIGTFDVKEAIEPTVDFATLENNLRTID